LVQVLNSIVGRDIVGGDKLFFFISPLNSLHSNITFTKWMNEWMHREHMRFKIVNKSSLNKNATRTKVWRYNTGSKGVFKTI
jgi:hypothetical protein